MQHKINATDQGQRIAPERSSGCRVGVSSLYEHIIRARTSTKDPTMGSPCTYLHTYQALSYAEIVLNIKWKEYLKDNEYIYIFFFLFVHSCARRIRAINLRRKDIAHKMRNLKIDHLLSFYTTVERYQVK